MKIFFALLIIVLLAFSGYHLTFRGFRLPLFARKFYLTGIEFLFLGLLLGPQFLNLLDRKTCIGLEPLSAFLLGWIGMLFGFQFEIAKLKRIPVEFFLSAVLEGIFTLILVFFGVYFTLAFLNITGTTRTVISLTLAAASACTAQTGIALLSSDFVAKSRETLTLLRYISSIDGLIALLVFSIVSCFCLPLTAESLWSGELAHAVVVNIIASAGIVLLYMLFIRRHQEENELTLVVIGMAVFTSGMASVLHYSPLLSNFFVGFCIANLYREKERIFQILISIEKPVYLLLLVFLGVGWKLDSVWIFILAAGYSLCRLCGKFTGGVIITRISFEMRRHPVYLGLGLIDQGGLPLAILFDFQQKFTWDITTGIVSVALVAIIYNDLLSPILLVRLMKEGR